MPNQQTLLKKINETAEGLFSCSLSQATEKQAYRAVCTWLREELARKRKAFRDTERAKGKHVYYMSMEFLVGPSLRNHLYNLGLEADLRAALKTQGIDLDALYAFDPDAGLGNGGLGRLAACYLDSLTGQNLPATGFSIRYEFGIFKQKIIDGWQMEFPDNWLEPGEVWLQPRPDESFEVRFGGRVSEWADHGRFRVAHTDYQSVMARPYDMYISGYNSPAVNKLVLWSAQLPDFDMSAFSRGEYVRSLEQNTMAEVISKVLYPADHHVEGKRLRLRQQYLLVSASLQSILTRHKKQHKTLDNLSDYVAIHINDTHPALCVPEMMRLLMDEYGYGWDQAWDISYHTLSYTNHTVMSEALERWSEWLFEEQLPRLYAITREINRRLMESLSRICPEDPERIERMAVIAGGEVCMANLCLVGCHTVNGVSKLHSRILTDSLFRDFYDLVPDRFRNVTNGIAYRRWLCQANPRLAGYLQELIGPGFLRDAQALEGLLDYADDPAVLDRLFAIKQENKCALAAHIAQENGIYVDPASIFDVQIKRLHEYKRQLLNVLHILYLYRRLKARPDEAIAPRTFIFGAKASPGYDMAKRIISLICAVADKLNADPQTRDVLKVVFLEDYRVSLAERVIPAADISQQISVAGKEASGTGNMKLMINGALTLGTLDGANVEICEQVGHENMFLFGLTVEEIAELERAGYDPERYLQADPLLQEVIGMLTSGELGRRFDEIRDSLRIDPYRILADFKDYAAAQERVGETYVDRARFMRMSLNNIAKAGIFSADRAVLEYARNIWKMR